MCFKIFHHSEGISQNGFALQLLAGLMAALHECIACDHGHRTSDGISCVRLILKTLPAALVADVAQEADVVCPPSGPPADQPRHELDSPHWEGPMPAGGQPADAADAHNLQDEATLKELDPDAYAAISDAYIQPLVDMVERVQQDVKSLEDLMKTTVYMAAVSEADQALFRERAAFLKEQLFSFARDIRTDIHVNGLQNTADKIGRACTDLVVERDVLIAELMVLFSRKKNNHGPCSSARGSSRHAS